LRFRQNIDDKLNDLGIDESGLVTFESENGIFVTLGSSK